MPDPSEPPLAAALSPDGRWAASTARGGAVRLWRVRDLALQQLWMLPSGNAFHLAFSPDSRLLASGCDDGGVHILNLVDSSTAALAPLRDAVTALSFSASGSLLAAASGSDGIRIHRVGDGRIHARLDDLDGRVLALAFHPARSLLAAGLRGENGKGVLRFWTSAGRRALNPHRLELPAGPRSLAFSPDGKTLASAGDSREISLWELEDWPWPSPRSIRTSGGPIRRIEFTPDGSAITSASPGGDVEIRSRSDGSLRAASRQAAGGGAFHAAYSQDGRVLLRAGAGIGEASLQLLDPGNASPLESFNPPSGPIRLLAFAAAEPLLAAAGASGRIRVVDFEKGRVLHSFSLGKEAPASMALSHDAALLAAGDSRGVVQLWSLKRNELLWQSPLAGGRIEAIGFSGDGTQLALVGREAVEIVDAVQGHRRSHVSLEGDARQVAFSVEEGRLAWSAGPNEVRSCRLWLGCRRAAATLLPGPFDRLSLSANGGFLMAEGAPGQTVQLFSIADDNRLKPVASIRPSPEDACPGAVYAVSHEGRSYAEGCADGRLSLVEVSQPSSLRSLKDESLPIFSLDSEPASVFRLDRAALGAIRLVADEACGDRGDGRCVTREGFLVLRFSGRTLPAGTAIEERPLEGIRTLHSQFLQPESAFVRGLTIALAVRGGVDLASGDAVTVQGIALTSPAKAAAGPRRKGWRFDSDRKRWSRGEFDLTLHVHPALEESIQAFAEAWPAASVRFLRRRDEAAFPRDSGPQPPPAAADSRRPQGQGGPP